MAAAAAAAGPRGRRAGPRSHLLGSRGGQVTWGPSAVQPGRLGTPPAPILHPAPAREATYPVGGFSAPRIWIRCSGPPAATSHATQAGGAATLLEVGGPSGEGFARMRGGGGGLGKRWEARCAQGPGGGEGASPRETTEPYFSSIASQYSSFWDGSRSPHSCRDTTHHPQNCLLCTHQANPGQSLAGPLRGGRLPKPHLLRWEQVSAADAGLGRELPLGSPVTLSCPTPGSGHAEGS